MCLQRLYLKTMIESGLNHYFIQDFLPFLKELFSKTLIHILCYASKPLGYTHKVFIKGLLFVEKTCYLLVQNVAWKI
jgi:hypothetical protein